jgi:aminoglycoside phosphotransferase (APT) family kinase protein
LAVRQPEETGGVALTWLGAPTVGALRRALRRVAPELAGATIVPRGLEPNDDPRWCGASAVVDGRFVVKFAWARPPAMRIVHQARVLAVLHQAVPQLPLPEVAKFACDPALLILRRVPATPFFELRGRIGPAERDGVARDLAAALAALHEPGALRAVENAAGPLPEPQPPATTAELRARFVPLVPPDRRTRVQHWCDWADRTLAAPGRTVLVHGDLHGDNHLWDQRTLRLRLVVDMETAGPGDVEFDLRCLPGDCGSALFRATVAQYEHLTGTSVDVDRVMAWHLRTVLGDALWRTEAGVPLPDGRSPVQWVDDLEARFAQL